MFNHATVAENVRTYAISLAAIWIVVCLMHGQVSAQSGKGKLLKFKINDQVVALQGKICAEEYEYGGSVMYIDYFYWGFDQGRIYIKRVVRTPDKTGMKRSEETIFNDVNANRVCSLEPVPGKRLMLELDNFNQVMVTQMPQAPVEGLEGY